MIYHITTEQDWNSAQKNGSYSADSLQSEGFIHCSTAAQVQATANRFYHGSKGLVLLHIDTNVLRTPVRFENLEGGVELFPHVYGAISLDAISGVSCLDPQTDGSFVIGSLK